MTKASRHFIVSLGIAILAINANDVAAQDSFPAPLPGQTTSPLARGGPSITPAVPFANQRPSAKYYSKENCLKDFAALREETRAQARLTFHEKTKNNSWDEACKSGDSIRKAEIKMMTFAKVYSSACGFSSQDVEELNNGYKANETDMWKLCQKASGAIRRKVFPPGLTGDFWPAGSQDQPGDTIR